MVAKASRTIFWPCSKTYYETATAIIRADRHGSHNGIVAVFFILEHLLRTMADKMIERPICWRCEQLIDGEAVNLFGRSPLIFPVYINKITSHPDCILRGPTAFYAMSCNPQLRHLWVLANKSQSTHPTAVEGWTKIWIEAGFTHEPSTIDDYIEWCREPSRWSTIIQLRKAHGLYAGDDFFEYDERPAPKPAWWRLVWQRVKALSIYAKRFRRKRNPNAVSRMRAFGERTIARTKQSAACVSQVAIQPKQELQPVLQPVSWLYSQGNPHGGLLLKDQYDNQYCAYGPLWGINQIGAWSQRTTAPNPPMNDSVLKHVSGPYAEGEPLPERLRLY